MRVRGWEETRIVVRLQIVRVGQAARAASAVRVVT
jgi:hypothetical protein